jgi:hypothetical protein
MQDSHTQHSSQKTPREQAFDWQIQTLNHELQKIDAVIARLDAKTQTTKYWAILVWGGSISLLLGQQTMNEFLPITAFLPVLFWIIEARWKYWLDCLIYREGVIAEFIGGKNLSEHFEKKSIPIKILDPLAKEDLKTSTDEKSGFWHFFACMLVKIFFPKFECDDKKPSFGKAFWSPEVSWLYIGMMLLSVVIWWFTGIITAG